MEDSWKTEYIPESEESIKQRRDLAEKLHNLGVEPAVEATCPDCELDDTILVEEIEKEWAEVEKTSTIRDRKY